MVDEQVACAVCEEPTADETLNDDGLCAECEFAADIRASERLRDNAGDR